MRVVGQAERTAQGHSQSASVKCHVWLEGHGPGMALRRGLGQEWMLQKARMNGVKPRTTKLSATKPSKGAVS